MSLMTVKKGDHLLLAVVIEHDVFILEPSTL